MSRALPLLSLWAFDSVTGYHYPYKGLVNSLRRAIMPPMLKIVPQSQVNRHLQCYIWRIECIVLKYGRFGKQIRYMWKILNCGAGEGQIRSVGRPFV
jgi:hypothetical protein